MQHAFMSNALFYLYFYIIEDCVPYRWSDVSIFPMHAEYRKNKWAHDVIFIANFLDNLRDHS